MADDNGGDRPDGVRSTAQSELGDEGAGATASGGDLGLGGDLGAGASDGGGDACATASAEVSPTPVDIIFAIDQSASMGEEIQGVIDNLTANLTSVLDSSRSPASSRSKTPASARRTPTRPTWRSISATEMGPDHPARRHGAL